MKIYIKNNYKTIIGLIGTLICFASDMMLGFYTPTKNEGILKLFPNFSTEWANVNKGVFIAAGALGVVAILMFLVGLYGVYEKVKASKAKYSFLFLIGLILFGTSAIFYHNVFAITAYTYNTLANQGVSDAYNIATGLFTSFIFVGFLAAIGFGLMCIYLIVIIFTDQYGEYIDLLVNPLVLMIVFVILALLLPQNKYVNGIFNMGQQSLSLMIFFVYSLIFSKEKSDDKEVQQ